MGKSSCLESWPKMSSLLRFKMSLHRARCFAGDFMSWLKTQKQSAAKKTSSSFTEQTLTLFDDEKLSSAWFLAAWLSFSAAAWTAFITVSRPSFLKKLAREVSNSRDIFCRNHITIHNPNPKFDRIKIILKSDANFVLIVLIFFARIFKIGDNVNGISKHNQNYLCFNQKIKKNTFAV